MAIYHFITQYTIKEDEYIQADSELEAIDILHERMESACPVGTTDADWQLASVEEL